MSEEDRDGPVTADAVLQRINTWLDATEAAEFKQRRRRRLRGLLVNMVLLGTVVALADLMPRALSFLATSHAPPADLAVRILTTGLSTTGAVILVVEYLEPIAQTLSEIVTPVACAAVICAGSLSGPDLLFTPLLATALAMQLLWAWIQVLKDIDAEKIRAFKLQPALRTALTRRLAGGVRTAAVADVRRWVNDRMFRLYGAFTAIVILATWPLFLSNHHGDSTDMAIWYGMAFSPLALVAVVVAVLRLRRTRTTTSAS